MAKQRSNTEPERATLAVGTPGRIGLWATLGSAGIGLFFALFQVQGWTMAKPLAIGLGVLLLGAVAFAVSMIGIEVWRVVRRFFEHRATSPTWVASDPPGLLDYEADALRAQNRFVKELNKLNRDTEALGRKLEKHSRTMPRLQQKSGRRKQRGANRSAKDINVSAVYIEKRVDLLKRVVKEIERNYQGWITHVVEIKSEADHEALGELRSTINSGVTTTAETLVSITEYRLVVENIEAMNLSRSVRKASERLAKALGDIETIFRAHEKASAGLVREVDQKLAAWKPQPS